MASQTDSLELLFRERMQVITDLSQANADCLRALQMHSGNDILMMMDTPPPEVLTAQSEADAEIEACRARIEALESDLSRIDQNIENCMQEKG